MREYEPGKPLVFAHIPKSAGTSLQSALREAIKPDVLVQGYDTSLFGGYDDIEAIHPSARRSIYLSPDELPAEAELVAGHIAPATTQERYPGADHITFLRVPQVRVLSQWLHSRSVSEFDLRHWGPSAEAFRAGWAPLRDYLQSRMVAPNVDNTITRFLAWPHPALSQTEFIPESADPELLAAATDRLASFRYVDVVENPAFLDRLGDWLGRELTHTRLNERTSVPPRRRPDLAAELDAPTRELLDHRTRLDSRLWSTVVRRVLPDVDPARLHETAFRHAVDHYAAMLREPDDARTSRRIVERLYEVGVKLGPRRRARAR